MLLGLETTCRLNSVAVWRDGQLRSEVVTRSFQDLSRRLPALVAAALEQAGLSGYGDLEALAVSVGPGSFTGIRIGVSYARALSQALMLPLVGVPTLRAVAAQAGEGGDVPIVPLITSRKGHCYWQQFAWTDGGLRELTPPQHDQVDRLRDQLHEGDRELLLCGEGVAHLGQCLIPPADLAGWRLAPSHAASPRAGTVARLGHEALEAGYSGDWREVLPLYVTESYAQRNLKRAGG